MVQSEDRLCSKKLTVFSFYVDTYVSYFFEKVCCSAVDVYLFRVIFFQFRC